MFSATDGINTHKGMIFSLGILCGVCGWRSCQPGVWRAEDLLLASGRAAQPALQSDFAEADGKTAGERQYLAYGIAGIRGEAASGFASIRETAWPFFQAKLAEGSTFEEAGVWTLLLLISRVEDTNMIKRGGREVQQQMQQQAAALLSQETAPMQEDVFRLTAGNAHEQREPAALRPRSSRAPEGYRSAQDDRHIHSVILRP